MASVTQATSTVLNPPAVRKPLVANAGIGFYAREFKIPEEEKPHLPCAINIFEELMTDPPQLTCSLSFFLFEDPVMDLAGHTYEKRKIQEHFDHQQEKGLALTTPLSNEILEARTLIPNRAKKSELEEYKTDTARKCFELATQMLKHKCGESALLLIDRVKQLNPKLEGLAAIEDQARETFISIQKQKETYIRRAEKALQEEKPQEAMRLLKSFMKPISYVYTHSQEPSWVIPGSTYVGMKSNFLVTRDAKKAEYTLWDLKTKNLISVATVDFLGNMEMSMSNVIALTAQNGCLLMFTDGKTKAWDQTTAQSKFPIPVTNYHGTTATRVAFFGLTPVIGLQKGAVLGWVYCRSLSEISWNDDKKCWEVRYYGKTSYNASLIYPDGTEKEIDFKRWFSERYEPLINSDHIKLKEFLQQYFPQISESGSSISSPEMSPSVSYPSIEWREKKSEGNKVKMDRYFQTDIQGPEEVKFYTLLLHAAVAQGDFDAYLYAIQHLVIHHQKADTWKVLEETMVGLGDRTQPFKERLEREIENAASLKEDFWLSRLHLFLGLLLAPLVLKLAAYKKGLQSYPADVVLKRATWYVKTLPLEALGSKEAPGIDLESYQQLQSKIQEQQKQIEKLQELVQGLLQADTKK